jgi:fumarate reductase subunit D
MALCHTQNSPTKNYRKTTHYIIYILLINLDWNQPDNPFLIMDMDMDINNNHNPSIFKALTWALFAATATISAFLLPVFIVASIIIIYYFPGNFNFNFSPIPDWIIYTTAAIIIFSSLYHSIYRIIASNKDLKLFRSLLFCVIMIGIFIVASEIFQFLYF